MKKEIKVPAMGESISEATIGAILKSEGAKVSADEELMELETDKVNQMIYAADSGIFKPLVKEGDTVKIGQVIGEIEAGPEGIQAEEKESKKEESKQEAKTETPAEAPAARKGARMTKEMFLAGIKNEDLRKSALEKEVEERPEEKKSEPREEASQPAKEGGRQETRKKMSKIRKVIAARLVDALQTTAMLTTFNEVDMSLIISLREKYKESFAKEHGVKLGFMSFFVKASVAALQEFPDINSYIDGDEIVHREYYDIGIAIGTDRGLIVPVVRDCDKLSFSGIESAIENFAKKARESSLNVDDLRGGGFTITNGGTYGSLLSTPILNPPQCAILGMHKIEKRPVVLNDEVAIRPMMYLALSYDHRIIDGKEAVSFLVHIKNYLEDPSRMLLEI